MKKPFKRSPEFYRDGYLFRLRLGMAGRRLSSWKSSRLLSDTYVMCPRGRCSIDFVLDGEHPYLRHYRLFMHFQNQADWRARFPRLARLDEDDGFDDELPF